MQELSLGNSKTLYGVKIKKLPIGKYLKLISKLIKFQEEITSKIFGNNSQNNILDNIINADIPNVVKIIENALIGTPEMAINFITEILEVDKEEFINNEDIGIYELVEIVETFIELNRLGELIEGKLTPMLQKLKEKTQNIGYKNLSPLDLK